jgi:hypothetical protein
MVKPIDHAREAAIQGDNRYAAQLRRRAARTRRALKFNDKREGL